AVGARLGRQHQVGGHIRPGGVPHSFEVLGAGGLVVEVPRAVVAGAATGEPVLQQVHGEEGAEQVAVPEHQVLVVLDRALAVEVQVEQLAGPDRKSTRLNSSHVSISYAVFCLKK